MFAAHRPGGEHSPGEARTEHDRLPPLLHQHPAQGARGGERLTPAAAASTAVHVNKSWQTVHAAKATRYDKLPDGQQHLVVSRKWLAHLSDLESLRISPHSHLRLSRFHKMTTNLPKLYGMRNGSDDNVKGLGGQRGRRGEGGVRLRALLAQHPTSIARLEPAMRMMLCAYGKASSPTHYQEYAWSEVFPLIHNARRLPSHDGLTVRTRSLLSSFVLPSVGQRSDVDEDRVGGEWEPRALDVKLPPIVFMSHHHR